MSTICTHAAYRPCHSTETALLHINNDLLRIIDQHQEVVLIYFISWRLHLIQLTITYYSTTCLNTIRNLWHCSFMVCIVFRWQISACCYQRLCQILPLWSVEFRRVLWLGQSSLLCTVPRFKTSFRCMASAVLCTLMINNFTSCFIRMIVSPPSVELKHVLTMWSHGQSKTNLPLIWE